MKKIILSLYLLSVCSCMSAQELIDKQATAETNALFKNLKRLSKQGIMFGHQEDEAYGIQWIAVAGKSDVKDVCASYPAVHGWDVGKEGDEYNIDHVSLADMKRWIIETYERGGVNTISWHVDNPATNGNAWDTIPAVSHILPNGKDHQNYVKRLDAVADFIKSCKSGSTAVPIIFRPFHEHNGNWFWWGKGNCTEQDYIQLWRLTVNYLKNVKQLHNLIYAFSPDRSRIDMSDATASYLYAYPGDAYVDVLGFDNYMDVGITWNKKSQEEQLKDLVNGLQVVSTLAKEKNKVAALTETGLEGVTNPAWFTEVILNPIKAAKSLELSYIMVWRNANEKHHYAPYPTHPAVVDFMKFYNDPYSLFERDIQNIYKAGKPLLK